MLFLPLRVMFTQDVRKSTERRNVQILQSLQSQISVSQGDLHVSSLKQSCFDYPLQIISHTRLPSNLFCVWWVFFIIKINFMV